MFEMKNTYDAVNSRLNITQKKISTRQGRDASMNLSLPGAHIIGLLKQKDASRIKRIEKKILAGVTVKIFPNIMKTIDLQTQEAQRTTKHKEND